MIGVSRPTVALAGVGRWGRFVLRDLERAGCRVEVVRRDTPIERLTNVDGFVIATPTPTHAPLAWRALTLDVPVFVEKPLASDVAEAVRLAAAGEGRLFVMDKWRWHPAVAAMRSLSESGALGPITELATRRLRVSNPHPGVDAVRTLALHDVAIALELLGYVPPARSATVTWAAGERIGMRARLGDRPLVALEVDAGADRTHTEVRLAGELATATLDGAHAGELRVAATGAVPSHWIPIDGEQPLLAELTAFAEHLRGGPAPRSTAAQHLVLLRRIEELGALG